MNDQTRKGKQGRKAGKKKSNKDKRCSVEGCNRPVLAKGLCSTHYRRGRYKQLRESAGLPYKPRAGRIRTVSDLRKRRKADQGPLDRSAGETPSLILKVMSEAAKPMAIDDVCAEVAKALGGHDPYLAIQLRGRVRHFLYTSPKISRVGRGVFKLK